MEFQKAIGISKNNENYQSLAISYYLLGNTNQSQKYQELANFIAPNSLSTSLLGFALIDMQEYDKAIEVFNRASAYNPTYYLPYKELGKTYSKIGNQEKSLQNFKKAALLNSFDGELEPYRAK